MEITELEAIYSMSKKAGEPIYLGYYKPKSRKKGVGYMDLNSNFLLYKSPKSVDYTSNNRYIRPVWDRNNLSDNDIHLVQLTKPDTKGTTMVAIEDVFIQNIKKMETIKVLFGANK